MPEVRETQDYRRVRDLPRRRLSERDAAAWAVELTRDLRRPGSRAALRPWQAYSLAEMAGCRGAMLGLGVGHGKTLITYLAATVLGASRAVLVIPAALREKTYADFAALARDWNVRQPPRIVTREELSVESGEHLLTSLRPDVILIDECDELANANSSAARRIDRYVVANTYSDAGRAAHDVVVVCMTGTLSRGSIMGYWHLLCWCLRDDAPVPLAQNEAREWALAIDEKKGRVPSRMSPGVLGATRELARAWYRARLLETPGVIMVDGDSCAAPLTVRVRLPREDAVLDRAYERFLKTLETPEGISVSDPLSRWRIDGQFGCGMYLRWRVQPPDEWRDAYRAKNAFVRERILFSARSSRPLDTEAQVMRRYADNPVVAAWLALRGTFEPETEAVWLTTSTIESVGDWLRESTAPGIVWTGCVEFAEALATATRLAYYGAEGRNQYGGGLHAADPRKSLIASWHANKRGFNLQPWTRQLLVMPPQSAKYLEQVFGRSHRAGQDRHVTVDVLATSGGTLDALDAALREASFVRATVGMTQKLLRADVQWAAPKINATNVYRWARKGGAKKVRPEACAAL